MEQSVSRGGWVVISPGRLSLLQDMVVAKRGLKALTPSVCLGIAFVLEQKDLSNECSRSCYA